MSDRWAAALTESGVRLRLNPLVRLHWRAWDAESVVFDEASGGTFQVGPMPALLLRLLAAGPAASQVLASEIAGMTGEREAACANAIEGAAAELHGYGLIDIDGA